MRPADAPVSVVEAMAAGISHAGLLERARSNDSAAWSELVERYSRYVVAIATHGYQLSHADAEDVFQEVFARTWSHLDRIHDDDALRPWIGQVTRRLCVDRIRAGQRVELDDGALLAASPAPDRLEQIELALDVHAALLELSPDCREVVDRFFVQDHSYARISEDTGLPAGTIASRISRCLVKLRERLD